MSTISFQTQALKEAVSKLSTVVTNKNVSDLLGSICFQIKNDYILVRSTDTRLHILTQIKSAAYTYDGEPFDFVLPGRKTQDVIAKLNGPTVKFEFKEKKVSISSGSAKADLVFTSSELYPKIPDMKDSNSFSIASDLLHYMYRKTSYAVARLESSPALTGLNHNITGKDFMLIACDRQRLALQHIDLETEKTDMSITVPTAAVEELKRQMKQSETVDILFNTTHICYRMKGLLIYSLLIENSYPNLLHLIPAKTAAKIQFDIKTEEFREALSRVSLFYDNDNHIGHFIVNPSTNKFRILSPQLAVGEIKEDLIVEKGQGEDLVFTLNIKYLQDVLAQSSSEYLTVRITDKEKPIVIQSKNDPSKNLDIVLPVRSSRNLDTIIDDFYFDQIQTEQPAAV